jgi:predicted nucleic acid-binding protein
MRAVLDTNVLLSALAFPGSKPDLVLQLPEAEGAYRKDRY